jgi:fido (protein-threonine AMPylation protein)
MKIGMITLFMESMKISLYENRYLYKMNIKTFRDHVRDTPVLIYQAHPFRAAVFLGKPRIS